MLQAFDAELLVVRGHGSFGTAGDGDEGRKIHLAARQCLREWEAHTR